MASNRALTRSEMTPEWFTSVLQGGGFPECIVSHVDLEHFGAGVMTDMVRAQLTYKNGCKAPSSVLVKYPSHDEGNLNIAKLMGLYEHEVRFYQYLAPQLTNLNIPRCYFASIDEHSGLFTLVLEDLSAHTKPGTILKTVTQDNCAKAFGELVNFQAPLWNASTLNSMKWLDNQRTLNFYDAIPNFLEPFLQRFSHALEPEHIKLLETVLPKAGKWIRSWQAPTVLCHGEFRAANILIGTSKSAPPVTIIDFQTVLLGLPGIDLAYFMGASLPTDQRRKFEHELLKNYHQQLMAAGITGFDWNACWRSYCESTLYGIYLYGGTSSEVEDTPENNQLIISMFRQMADMAIDLEATQIAKLN